jgi:ArsR family transcriptional regulator
MTLKRSGQDDADRLRAFKAEFFKALGHPLRIQILELLRNGPLGVTQILAATGAPGSSVSQQLGILRARDIVVAERRGTAIIYTAADPELFELLDVARVIFNAHLADAIDMLRLVGDQPVGAAEP